MRLIFVLFFMYGCGDIASSNSTSNNQQAQEQAQQPSSCSQQCCGSCQDSLEENLDRPSTEQERACAFCCSEGNEVSEASCVDRAEGGAGNPNGDCEEAILIAAGCSPDLSQRGGFLSAAVGQ